MSVFTQSAIDVHAHFGTCVGHKPEFVNGFMTADAARVAELARQNNIRITIVSPLKALFPRLKGDVLGGNREAFEKVAQTEGLMQWVVVNPLEQESFNQAADMLQSPQCAGIKIHPEEHGYPIKEEGKVLFEFAAKHQATIITHSGEQNSMPEDFVLFANEFPELNLILAHIGCGWDRDPTHQVRAVQSSKPGNVYADTSSAMNTMPGLIEWAVKEIGADKILFGTDSPLYFLPMQRARIEYAEIEQAEKCKIFFENAKTMLNLNAFVE